MNYTSITRLSEVGCCKVFESRRVSDRTAARRDTDEEDGGPPDVCEWKGYRERRLHRVFVASASAVTE